MTMLRALLFGSAVTVCGLTAGAPNAAADFLNRHERATGMVTACSTYGHFECYKAPLRRGKFGPEMRLRGGTWIGCSGDCRDTLRKQTVDFWDEQRRSSGGR
jgi:hypothetical protein